MKETTYIAITSLSVTIVCNIRVKVTMSDIRLQFKHITLS